MADKYTLPDKPAASDSGQKGTEDTAPKKEKRDGIHVRVSSPFRIFFDDMAQSLSGANATGPFDILPHHHNFITLLSEGDLSIRTYTGEVKIRISGGLMHVKADQVIVFLNV
jgi:F0F1-type ATP synthase epsilon subunit